MKKWRFINHWYQRLSKLEQWTLWTTMVVYWVSFGFGMVLVCAALWWDLVGFYQRGVLLVVGVLIAGCAILPNVAYRYGRKFTWLHSARDAVTTQKGVHQGWHVQEDMDARFSRFEESRDISMLTLSDIHFAIVFYSEDVFWRRVKVLLCQNDEEHTRLYIESGCPNLDNIEHIHHVLQGWLSGGPVLTNSLEEIILY